MNDGFRLGVIDEIRHNPMPIDLPLKGYEFYQQYFEGRRFVNKLRGAKRWITPITVNTTKDITTDSET